MPDGVGEAFVSYAQNFEDVMLWRALGHVDRGFYIDIGASWPVGDSVTRAFSERGWRGINVEPDAQPFEALQRQRSRDVNLQVAVSNVTGEVPMHFVAATGNSTLSPAEADLRAGEGRQVVTRDVPVRTLAAIWDEHVEAGQEVHFLKIDVESSEREVLDGLDWGSRRPWIVVVEATRPNSREQAHAAWEPILLVAGYTLVHRDGINRFYVSPAHPELAAAFEFPPNYWDHFVSARERDAEQMARRALSQLAAMRASRSWRWTRPLRRLGRVIRRGAGAPG